MTPETYAKHRQVTRQAVMKALRNGRLGTAATKDATGRWQIDPVEADVAWSARTDEGRAPVPKSADYSDARARREAANASMAETKLMQMRGELVLASEVEETISNYILSCRTKILGIPSRIQQSMPHLAAKDVAQISGFVDEALTALADEKDEDEGD